MHLSIVSPVYQAEELIDELVLRLLDQILPLTSSFEIIFVEDGSRDGSWEKVEKWCLKDERIKGVQLSRNFGQHAAIAAGIEAASGEWVVVMDCDLQDRPEEIPALYHKAQEGYEVVLARRNQRRSLASKLFYYGLSFLSGITYDSSIANFGIYHRKAIDPMLQIQSSIQYFPAMVHWVGFRQTTLLVDHAERPRGKSSYSFAKKFRLALNVMLVYSDKLLRMMIGFGMLISLFALVFAGSIVFRALRGTIPVSGYPSLIVSISFFSGVIIFTLGVLGLYVGKIFESIKAKPTYLIYRKING